jgi:hypothetical protein
LQLTNNGWLQWVHFLYIHHISTEEIESIPEVKALFGPILVCGVYMNCLLAIIGPMCMQVGGKYYRFKFNCALKFRNSGGQEYSCFVLKVKILGADKQWHTMNRKE